MMQAAKFPALLLYKPTSLLLLRCSEPIQCFSQTTCIALHDHFFKRKFHSSTYHLVRRIRRDDSQFTKIPREESINEDDHSISTEKLQTKKLLDEAVKFDRGPKRDPTDKWTSDPYKPLHKFEKQSQGRHFIKPRGVKAEETSIILFPGQGTQYVGMGKKLLDYPNVTKMYEQASEILGYDILKLSCEGPAEDLDQTKYQQPAIFLASLAAVEKLRAEQPNVLESCIGTAGFSVGEITALTFAGAINLWNAVHLVKARAEAMQIVSQMTRSGMMTVFYHHDSRLKFACSVAKEYCQKIGLEEVDCRVANVISPTCKVIAGNEEALQFIIKNKEDFKLKKIRRLNVSGAFHTDLMKPAALIVREVLDNIPITRPEVPVYSNVDGKPYKNANQIKRQLPKQVYYPVRWEQTLHVLYERGSREGYPLTFECGPGASLKAILKMVNAKAWSNCTSIEA